MTNSNTLLGCAYCGDTMDMPSEEMVKKFGAIALNCCETPMIQLNKGNLYRLLKGLDKLKSNVETEITKDF